MVLQIGVSNSSQQKELGAIKNPPCRRLMRSWKVLNSRAKLQLLLLKVTLLPEAIQPVEVDGTHILQEMPAASIQEEEEMNANVA